MTLSSFLEHLVIGTKMRQMTHLAAERLRKVIIIDPAISYGNSFIPAGPGRESRMWRWFDSIAQDPSVMPQPFA